MSIAESMLPEYDQEMGTTRRYLERVPEDKFDFKPHEKSMSLGRLAGHLVEMVGWLETTAAKDTYDISPDHKGFEPSTRAELLEKFDADVKTARAALAEVSDEAMMAPWTLTSQGNEFFKMPRIACLRGMCMNHIVHHRGQLSVYLRENDVPVPATYGPSADEQGMG